MPFAEKDAMPLFSNYMIYLLNYFDFQPILIYGSQIKINANLQ